MSDFFEIDFLGVETSKSGDAIPIRYAIDGLTYIHVVDGGYQETGEQIVDHIEKYYDNARYIDHVVLTHPDSDHAGGLRKVLEEFEVGTLWMLRPWQYADLIIDRFANYTSIERLKTELKEAFPNIAALEEIAESLNIPILEPFQGASIGEFCVLAPSRERYLDLLVNSENTPDSIEETQESLATKILRKLKTTTESVKHIRALWGEEIFPSEGTSAENEMSVIQYADLCGKKILLTADAGREALQEAATYSPNVGLSLPGIDRFQIPHHGSRHNVSTDILDTWLGTRLQSQLIAGDEKFLAIVSSAKDDEDHPRKSVIRAFIHRGAKVLATEGIDLRSHYNAPTRDGWSAATPLDYPEEQEDN